MKDTVITGLNDFDFNVFPYIQHEEGRYFLIYQINTDGNDLILIRNVHSKVEDDKFYFFFSVAISSPEQGELMKIEILKDDFENYFFSDNIYWLNPNDETLKLERHSSSPTDE